jgi:hypothetical protein
MQTLIASEAGTTKTKKDLVELGKKTDGSEKHWERNQNLRNGFNDEYNGGDVTIEICISLFDEITIVVAQISQVWC